jgi:hypothetical protein
MCMPLGEVHMLPDDIYNETIGVKVSEHICDQSSIGC